jgi:hypothetical protein
MLVASRAVIEHPWLPASILFFCFLPISFIQNGLLFVKVNAPAAHPRWRATHQTWAPWVQKQAQAPKQATKHGPSTCSPAYHRQPNKALCVCWAWFPLLARLGLCVAGKQGVEKSPYNKPVERYGLRIIIWLARLSAAATARVSSPLRRSCFLPALAIARRRLVSVGGNGSLPSSPYYCLYYRYAYWLPVRKYSVVIDDIV